MIFSTAVERPTAGDPVVQSDLDLRRDVIRAAVPDRKLAPAATRRKIWYGVAEGALEHEWGVLAAVSLGVDPHPVSTSGLVDGGGGLTVLDAAHPAPADAPPDTAACARESLARRERLVAPTPSLHAGPNAWWSVAANGDTRAILGDDLGHFTQQLASQTRGFPGGSGRAGVNYVNPNGSAGRAPRLGNMQPRSTRPGDEYGEVVYEVDLQSFPAYCVYFSTIAVSVGGMSYIIYKIATGP